MFWNFIDESHKSDVFNEETDNSGQQWQWNTEPSLSGVSQMALPLCGKPAGRNARVLRL